MSSEQTIVKPIKFNGMCRCSRCGNKYSKSKKIEHNNLCNCRELIFKVIENKDKLQDSMTYDLLFDCIKNYNETIIFEKTLNKSLKKKKIRKTNFPSHISENIVKFAFYKIYKVMPTWDTDKGDLLLPQYSKRIECKGSIDLGNGPPTFGPKEKWDYIYFVDGIETLDLKYKVYEIKLKNNSNKWKNMMVNKTETYYDHCIQGRRPRLRFDEISKNIGKDCKLIFDGHISELDNSL